MIEIIKLDHQGRGIGKINNKIVFVPNALPGEIIEIKIVNEKTKYLEGQAIKYIKTSNKRIKPACPYYNMCGGCNLMHLSYEDQLKYKQEKTIEIINKYTKLNIKINKIIPCNKEYNYRNKITFHTNDKIGLYKNNSHEIININKCLIANNKINEILKELNKLKFNNQDITVRSNNIETLIYYKGNINNIEKINADTIINEKQILKGNGYIIEKLNNKEFIISPTSFFQINTNQTIKLYEKIKEYTNNKNLNKILDLYCGTGTIGIYISNNQKEILGVEINKEAIKDANKNKILNKIKNANFIAGDAKDVIKKLKFKPDIIIVDPPRSGLYKGMINDLIKLKPKIIIYVSCNVITLARDLKTLNNLYETKEIQPLDLFPQTHHVECVCLLKLK